MAGDAQEIPITRTRARRGTAVQMQRVAIKTRKYLSMDIDAAQRLGVHALMSGRNEGEIVTELVRAHLRDYHVRRGASRESGDESAEAAA
jgi:hypothetical protein